MKNSLLFILILLVVSCTNNAEQDESLEMDSTPFKVEYFGALKNIMHKNDISAKVNLSDFKGLENFYALGAFENLKGEIQIFNGEPFSTVVKDSTLEFDKTYDKKATLLVYATVQHWNDYKIPDTVKSKQQLEDYITHIALNENIEMPFPFLLSGTPVSVNWHVINWKDGDTEHSHQKHIESGLNGTVLNKNAEMLGFYSDSHHAIFTHHTTNMHIHFRTLDNTLAGHVDDMELGENMILKLPK